MGWDGNGFLFEVMDGIRSEEVFALFLLTY
jgi:hypothetical protein